MVGALIYLILDLFNDKEMNPLLNANGKLEKIMSSDGVVAAKISGDAWKALTDQSREEWNKKAMDKKLCALNSVEGKTYLQQKCIDELTVISNVKYFQINDLESRHT